MKVDEYLTNFVGLSAILTGYDANVIAPTVDPLEDNSIARQYLRLMLARADNEVFFQTLALFGTILSNMPASTVAGADPTNPWTWNKDPSIVPQVTAQVEALILVDDDMAAMTRRMTRLWYLATWYTNEPPDADGMVVSMDAYQQGLAWPTFQAHPMGYSELDFGYWKDAPAAAAQTPPAPPVLSAPSATPPATEKGGTQRGGV
jgi:hypothetical protein